MIKSWLSHCFREYRIWKIASSFWNYFWPLWFTTVGKYIPCSLLGWSMTILTHVL